MSITRDQIAGPDSSPTHDAQGREILGWEEAIARYYGEWVLMKVLAFDDNFVPIHGIIIAHSPDRGVLSEALAREPPRQPDAPYQPYYPFNAFPRLRPGESLEQGEERFARQRAAVEAARG